MKITKMRIYIKEDFPEYCIDDCYHPGSCDQDVKAWVKDLKLSANKKDLVKYLKGFGAWEDSELKNHQSNLMRLLWLIAGDITNQGEFIFE